LILEEATKSDVCQILSQNENNLEQIIDFYRRLLSPNEKNNLRRKIDHIREILSFSENIFSSPSVALIFLYFCLNGAATAWTLQRELHVPESTVYRALKKLRSLGVIYPALKVSKVRYSRGGPRPIVWAIVGASTEEISKALRLHYRSLSPKYCVAERLAQTILDRYLKNGREITYREILVFVKELKIPFEKYDIAELIAQYLNEIGVKVWR